MTSGQIKFLTLIFALVNVWLLFHIPAVSEATLKFISVGEVPGTNTSLSPDTMLYLAAGSFAVSVVLIFWREFRKLFKRRKSVPVAVAVAEVPVVPMSPADSTSVVVVDMPSAPRRPAKKPPVMRWRALVAPRLAATLVFAGRHTSKLLAACRVKLVVLAARASCLAKRLAVSIRVLAVRSWRWLVPRAKHLWRLVKRFAKATWLLTIDIWRWLEPHIRHFDRWLERQLRRHRTSADALKMSGALSSAVAVRARKLGYAAKSARDSIRKAWRTTNE